jgi:hypothetical protein
MTQSSDLDDFAIQRPPDLTPEHFSPCIPVVEAEIERLRTASTRVLAVHEHVQLVLAEAWLAHLDEFYVTKGCRPFRGDVGPYVKRLAVGAARDIHDFLTTAAPIWRPEMWYPRFGGRLHRAVAYLVDRRIEARGGGCELCHAGVHLDLHHLHYRSFGFEIPSDVMKLCRACHMRRHRAYGYPRDVRWQNGMQ